MKYAVIQTGGKQYRVAEGAVIDVDRLPLEKEKDVRFDNVLLVTDDGKVQIGTPYLSDVSVLGKVLEQVKGEKIHVAKFKAKVRYRRLTGFRSQLTRVQIEKIGSKNAKTPEVTKEPAKKRTAKKTVLA